MKKQKKILNTNNYKIANMNSKANLRFGLTLLIALVVTASCTRKTYTSVDDMVKAASETVEQLTPDSVLGIMMNAEEAYYLIDVRQETEYYYGYIPGSMNLPRGSLEFNIGNAEYWDEKGLYMPRKDELILLYCKKGQRSILAANSLKMLGYKNVKIIKGGYKAWELAYPDYTEKNLEMLKGGGETEHASSGGC